MYVTSFIHSLPGFYYLSDLCSFVSCQNTYLLLRAVRGYITTVTTKKNVIATETLAHTVVGGVPEALACMVVADPFPNCVVVTDPFPFNLNPQKPGELRPHCAQYWLLKKLYLM